MQGHGKLVHKQRLSLSVGVSGGMALILTTSQALVKTLENKQPQSLSATTYTHKQLPEQKI